MNVLVAYDSRTGRTLKTAEAIAETVRGMGGQVTLKKAADVKVEDVQNADAVFIGTLVHGLILFGVQPAGVERWSPMLPSLAGKPVGVFCTYAFHPRGSLQKLCDIFKAKGAMIKNQQAFHRSNPTKGIAEFVNSVIQPARA